MKIQIKPEHLYSTYSEAEWQKACCSGREQHSVLSFVHAEDDSAGIKCPHEGQESA